MPTPFDQYKPKPGWFQVKIQPVRAFDSPQPVLREVVCPHVMISTREARATPAWSLQLTIIDLIGPEWARDDSNDRARVGRIELLGDGRSDLPHGVPGPIVMAGFCEKLCVNADGLPTIRFKTDPHGPKTEYRYIPTRDDQYTPTMVAVSITTLTKADIKRLDEDGA